MRRALILVLLCGCALTKKSKPLEVRYFSPEAARARSAPAVASGLELRLGRISGPSYLKDEIVYRDGGQELGFYPGLRWIEPPEQYLRRAFIRELFQVHGIRQVVSGAAVTLDVELETFEERRTPRRVARVELSWRLRTDKVVLVQRTVSVDEPIGRQALGAPDAVATAMARALTEALHKAVADIVVALAAPAVSQAAL